MSMEKKEEQDISKIDAYMDHQW